MLEDKEIKLSHHEYTIESASSIAGRIIEGLDNKGFGREDVEIIANWVQYLSTQN